MYASERRRWLEEDSVTDVTRKWCGGYLRVKTGADQPWEPAYIRDIVSSDTSRFCLRVTFPKREGVKKRTELKLNPWKSGVKIDFSYPTPKLVKAGYGVYYMSRINDRQWKQSFSSDNTRCGEVLMNTRQYFGYQSRDPFERNVYDMMIPTYLGDNALRAVWNGSSFLEPYDSQVWVGYDILYPRPVVGIVNTVIGELVSRSSIRLFNHTDFLKKSIESRGIRVED
jgi:hypothetical protein